MKKVVVQKISIPNVEELLKDDKMKKESESKVESEEVMEPIGGWREEDRSVEGWAKIILKKKDKKG